MQDLISRQAAIDALDVLCQEHRYRIPGKRETYSQYNEAWQDALDRAEGAIGNLPSAQPVVQTVTDRNYRSPDTEASQAMEDNHEEQDRAKNKHAKTRMIGKVVAGGLMLLSYVFVVSAFTIGACMLVVYFSGMIGWLAYLILATVTAVMVIAAIKTLPYMDDLI